MKNDPLEIPDFMDRRGEQPAGKSRRRQRKQPWAMPALPYGKRPPKTLKGAVKVTLHLMDEAPRIGCGRRLVWAKTGRKWAQLCDAGGYRGRVSLKEYERLRERAEAA